MIKSNEELGNGLFAQINWTIDDVLEAYPDWLEEDAELFLQEIEDDLLDMMSEYGFSLIENHRAAEKYEPPENSVLQICRCCRNT
jgi:hypothetical protein